MNALVRLAAAAALCAGAAACMSSTDPNWGSLTAIDAPMGPTFGNAVASMDNQIIDPTPAVGLPSTSAARAARGIRRYEDGKVINPKTGSAGLDTAGGAEEEAPPSDEGGDIVTPQGTPP